MKTCNDDGQIKTNTCPTARSSILTSDRDTTDLTDIHWYRQHKLEHRKTEHSYWGLVACRGASFTVLISFTEWYFFVPWLPCTQARVTLKQAALSAHLRVTTDTSSRQGISESIKMGHAFLHSNLISINSKVRIFGI